MRYLSVPFAAGFELSFFRDFFGRRLRRLGGAGRGGGGRGGGRRRRPVSVGRVAPITVAQRPGARRLARGRGGRRRARGRRRRRSGRRRRRSGRRGGGRRRRSQTQRGRELGLAFVEPGGVFARRYRVGRLFASGLLQNGVQVYRPFVRRP